MQYATFRRVVVVFFALLFIAAVAGAAIAQDDFEEPPISEDDVLVGDPAWYEDTEESDNGLVEAGAEDIVLAQPPYTMNYQGYLTNAAGSPLNGTYDIEASLWNAATAGAQRWGPEGFIGIDVENGLFHLVLGESLALQPNVFDEMLFLELTVDTPSASTTLPRQPLRSTAYAYGLVPGAEVQGNPAGTAYGLTVDNTGTASNDRGLYARGKQYGIFADSTTSNGDAVYAADYVNALGIRSRRDSYLFVPGAIAWATGNLTASPQANGGVRLRSTAAGTQNVYIPITIPGELMGQGVTVEAVTVYYKNDTANSFITATLLRKQTTATNYADVYTDTTDRKSIANTSYTVTPATGKLDSGSGALTLRLQLTFANTTDDIFVGSVRLRLGHAS